EPTVHTVGGDQLVMDLNDLTELWFPGQVSSAPQPFGEISDIRGTVEFETPLRHFLGRCCQRLEAAEFTVAGQQVFGVNLIFGHGSLVQPFLTTTVVTTGSEKLFHRWQWTRARKSSCSANLYPSDAR